MRGLLTFISIAAIGGGLFFWQKQNEQKAAATNIATPQQPAAAKSVLTPAPRGQASEYNWMKRSIDRAAGVRDQGRARTKEAQDQ